MKIQAIVSNLLLLAFLIEIKTELINVKKSEFYFDFLTNASEFT